ncbi:MAG: Rrf2 family transcriptional regulator [Ilumatobacteraceae bacterium]|nr:Rrf2 family transcriptional regulator [Ilumatobacteraceae bacterium]
MRLSEGVEWTVHCCTVLGAVPHPLTVSGARLAEFHGVPAPYLVKQLQKLSQAGIVEAVAGRNGGYRLARPANKISLLDIVLALEGSEPAFRCTEIRQQGPTAIDAPRYPRPCGIARAMWRAEDAWRAELAAVTIDDINGELATSVDPVQIAKAIEWFQEVLQ